MLKKIITVLLIVQFLAACNNGDEALDQAPKENFTDPEKTGMHTHQNDEKGPIVTKRPHETANAKEMVLLTERVEGVKSARAIVSVLYTVIGVELKDGSDRTETMTKIYTKLNEHSHGANALVTTDPKHLKKMDTWGQAINERRFNEKIHNELGRMISQIKPKSEYPIRKSNPTKEELDRERMKDLPNGK